MSNVWKASDPAGSEVEFLSRDGIDPYQLVHEHGLGLPILVVDKTDGDREVAVILPNDDIESSQRLRVEYAEVEQHSVRHDKRSEGDKTPHLIVVEVWEDSPKTIEATCQRIVMLADAGYGISSATAAYDDGFGRIVQVGPTHTP
jgi:hypothetical protein